MSEPISFTVAGALRGARGMLAILPGVMAFALVYGFLAGQKGMTALEIGLSSALVFAGASQFLALELWGDPLPFLSLVAGVFIINLRHALMGPALLPWLAPLSPLRAYGSLYFMVDESWGLSVADLRAGGRDAAFLLGSGLALWLVWVSCSILGRLAGDVSYLVEDWGLDYLTTAFFVALLAAFWRGRHDLLPWTIAAAVAVSTRMLLPGTWYIVLGALAGSLAGAWVTVRGRR